jgi:hypothetical protein
MPDAISAVGPKHEVTNILSPVSKLRNTSHPELVFSCDPSFVEGTFVLVDGGGNGNVIMMLPWSPISRDPQNHCHLMRNLIWAPDVHPSKEDGPASLGRTFDPPLVELPISLPPHQVAIRGPIPQEMGLNVGNYALHLSLRDGKGGKSDTKHLFELATTAEVNMSSPNPLDSYVGNWTAGGGRYFAKGSTERDTWIALGGKAFTSSLPQVYEYNALMECSFSDPNSIAGLYACLVLTGVAAEKPTFFGLEVSVSGDKRLRVALFDQASKGRQPIGSAVDLSGSQMNLKRFKLTVDFMPSMYGKALVHIDDQLVVGYGVDFPNTPMPDWPSLGLTYRSQTDADSFSVEVLNSRPSRYWFGMWQGYKPQP